MNKRFQDQLQRIADSKLRILKCTGKCHAPHELTEAVICQCVWVKPERRFEVGFMERTKSGRLRHAEFRRLIG